ncbi:MAG TPA: hypothetical protein VFV65_03460 [Gemmatimonadales bacterium]|nr:hypothetical protein [Gemmatimonadales bacterium]
MIAGRRYWIIIWYGFLLVGLAGVVASAYWGRRTRGGNLDEILRAVATVILSVGMLLLLHGVAVMAGRVLLGAAVALFFGAFWTGRPPRRPPPGAAHLHRH